MKCPVDGATLMMTDRAGVEIDYCPTCRGVWLDRGELDKIIEKSAAPVQQAAAPQRRSDRDHDDDDRRPHKRRESFLSELFDF